jgi:hypothetical protein
MTAWQNGSRVMRLSNLFGALSPNHHDDASGVTLDVMTGIVAGIALVLAILILASSLNQAQADAAHRPALTSLR